ncbi:o-succinylbenzoate synthase [Flagellimonas sp. HMM57]|uniref:o-succinylbenzoate synthase n=1 Tax=unclassified Flagellimonas TaxID=2644544 RepID=UPI0013D09996|nr:MULTISPECIES: o-succinylbenzoate synthase [unclassified Flagellimonas]UII76035.1 o-succinylbenzoate synthase [Flagellimonas sp. HMM57]
MKASYTKYTLDFKAPSGTSRGIMTKKETWFLVLQDDKEYGIGECGLLKGLSIDDVPDYESKLSWVCNNIHLGEKKLLEELIAFPSIQFGVEQAFLSLKSNHPFELFPSEFTTKQSPILINGLIWMGSEAFMLSQLEQKLKEGFKCIKMKIGAIDFETELKILKSIRTNFTVDEIELRVDANGAFSFSSALEKLEKLSEYQIHSIEQPIKPNNWEVMAGLCEKTPLPIALDEELIGTQTVTEKEKLLQTIRPQYIILKPSLIGGYAASLEWISLAEKNNIGWWVTSALESNIGLNAIAQWTHTLKTTMPQGLGTGSLYTNNIESPLEVSDGKLFYRSAKNWRTNIIKEICT